MFNQQKVGVIVKKQQRDKRERSLLVENDKTYDSDIVSTDPDQEEDLNLLENKNDSQIQIFVTLPSWVSKSHKY